jgi:glycerol kinase
MMVGITRGTTSSHIARAALESIAYQTMDVIDAMKADADIDVKELRVDGGATVNNFLMQFQCDVLNTKIIRPKITETTALGAAYLAGLAVGYWKDLNDISNQWQVEKTFEPQMPSLQKDELIKEWKRAIKAVQAWSGE